MKKYTFCIAAFACAIMVNTLVLAQGGIINSVTGCYSCISSPTEGMPALWAQYNNTTGIALDAARNVYVADSGFPKVRVLRAATSTVFTVAGTGTPGFAGDSGPATAALLNNPQAIAIDGANNLYIADAGNNRVRKVAASTGIITTVAGGGVSTSDGVAATTASLTPFGLYVDAAGNIYTGGSNKIRKINGSTGIITTIAGNGSATNSGDGGPATNAGIAGPARCITADAAGNLYIIPGTGELVRKIDAATGIITTVAGGGPCLLDGVPATACQLSYLHSCGIDGMGNIILADEGNSTIRQIDASSGIIHNIAGGGVSLADNIPASTALVRNYMLYVDAAGGNVYYSTYNSWARKLSYFPVEYASYLRDSFSVSINKSCSGPQLTMTAFNYLLGMNVKTWWGDGQNDMVSVAPGCLTTGSATIAHTYSNSGYYTLKQVLYSGTTALDSFRRAYHHILCNSINLQFYFDGNGDCIKDISEPLISQAILVEVDSNGIAVDTISATSGLYYTAYGNAGDVYQFRVLSKPGGLITSCPITGIVSDTLQPIIYNTKVYYIGFSCGASSIDFAVSAVVPVTGKYDQWGNIYVWNTYCNSIENATVTLTFSPKYKFGRTRIIPTSVSGNVIKWNVTSLSANAAAPLALYYELDNPSTGPLTAGDTVVDNMTIAAITGSDSYLANNHCEVIDTVNASCDPNEIWVSPTACITTGPQQLEYTINFENTGNDTAFNIHVMDTLSDNVDVQSLRMVLASSEMHTTLIRAGGHNIYKFDFPNVNLLDSSHHGQCDGAFIFNINTKGGMPVGTQISNRVGIYFDDNDVVMTNTVTNTVCLPTDVPVVSSAVDAQIFPNPTTNELSIKTDKGAYSSCTITNSLGQVLMQQPLNTQQTTVSVNALPAGLYYITLKGENGSKVQKFVKM